MSFYLPEIYQNYILERISECDNQAMCSQIPTTYFNAIHPDAWIAEHAYVIGDTMRPPVSNGFIYECVSPGTSGSAVPGWGSVQNQEFSDGTITWKTHANYALVNTTRITGDYTIADYSDPVHNVYGRSISLAEKMGVIIHTAGTVTHCALTCSTDKSLRYAATAQTTVGDPAIESGRITVFYELVFVVADPTLLA